MQGNFLYFLYFKTIFPVTTHSLQEQKGRIQKQTKHALNTNLRNKIILTNFFTLCLLFVMANLIPLGHVEYYKKK